MSLVFLPRQQSIDQNGLPREAALAYFYASGTSTPITVYTTGAYSVAHTNPVESVSGGLFPAIHVNPSVNSTYKLVLIDADGTTVYSEDNIPTEGSQLRSDLASTVLGSEGARLVGMKHSEAGSTAFTVFTKLRKSYYLREFGAAGDGVTDDSAALKACYAACAAAGRNMLIENGSYRYLLTTMATGLLFDQKVNVIGEDWELTKLLCDSDGAAVRVDNNSDFRHFEEFQIAHMNSHTGVGLDGWLLSRTNFRRIWSTANTSHGILCRSGNGPTFDNCRSVLNGGDGLKIESFTGSAGQSCNCVNFKGLMDLISNTGWGFNNQAGTAHHGGLLMLQNNGAGNARVNDIASDLVMYLENPTSGIELQMTATGVRNRIVYVNDSTSGAGIQDATGQNFIVPLATLAGVLSPYYGPGLVGAAAAGRDGFFSGGNGGAGGTGTAGGRAFLTGGDAGGSTLANGGDTVIDGGAGANGGAKGKIKFGGTGATALSKYLSATSVLDFDLTAVTYQDLTVAVTGARDGDIVTVTPPAASVAAGMGWAGWVSANDVVTVRAFRVTGTPNPASGTFRVSVWQH